IVNDRLTGNDNGYCLDRELAVSISHVEGDREGALRSECRRVASACSGRWSSSAPPCNRVRGSSAGWRRGACDGVACGGGSTATVVNDRLTGDCYEYQLEYSLPRRVGQSRVDGERALCRVHYRKGGLVSGSGGASTGRLPAERVRLSSTRRGGGAGDWF